jgi:hypothetical protein
MLSRITLSLALTIAVLVAPATPIELAKAVSSRTSCSAHMQMKTDPCQHCPMTPPAPSSSSGTTCCSVQAPCFVGYSNASDDFVAGMRSTNVAQAVNDRVNVRFQRPPVPPPRHRLS